MSDLLTTDEAADYLRLSERKLYELVANGEVPCTSGDRTLAISARGTRPLGFGWADCACGTGACDCTANRRRQSGSIAGLGTARKPQRPRKKKKKKVTCRKAARRGCGVWCAAR